MEALDLAAILCGGLAGSTIFGLLRPDKESNGRAVITILGGVMVSAVCTPAICRYDGLDAFEYRLIISFVIGLIGMASCKIVIVAIQTAKPEGAGKWFLDVAKKFLGIRG